MVQEGAARHQHPRDKLRAVQNQHARALAAAAPADLMPQKPDQRRQPDQPDDRPGHARNAGLHAVGQVTVAVVPHRAQAQQPSVPAALKRVGRLQRRMVAEHRHLALPPVAEAERRIAPPVRQIGPNVEAERQQHIKQHAAHRRGAELRPEAGPFLLPARIEHAQIQHGQPGPGVDAGPLGCAAQPERNAAQRHRQQRAVHTVGQHPLAIPHHTVGSQQDKKRTVNVNRCQTALGKAHKIQRQQHACGGCRPRFAGQAAHKAPRQRHQQHTEQRTREPPAERRHAEQRNADHDQVLAQRRMGRLVDGHFVQLLIAGAAMVDLVKIHAVQLADRVGHGGLLVKQRAAARDRHQPAVGIAERQLKQLGVLDHDRQLGARRQLHVVRCPAEAGAVVQLLFKDRAAVGIGHRHAAAEGDARVDPQRYRAAVQRHTLGERRACRVQRVLRRGAAAEIAKAQHRRGRRQRQQRTNLAAGPFRLRCRHGRGSFRLCLGQGQRVAMAGNVPHCKDQQHKADRLPKAGQDGHCRAGRARQPFIVGAGQRVDRGQIDEPGQRQADARRIQADVVPVRGGQQRQQHAGHHVALVHTVRKRKNADAVVRRQQQR